METNTNTNTPTKSESTPTKSESTATTPAMSGGDASSREGTPGSGYRRSSSVNMRKMQKMFQNAAEENVRSIRAYVTELKERVAKLQYQKQLLVCQVCTSNLNFFSLVRCFYCVRIRMRNLDFSLQPQFSSYSNFGTFATKASKGD
jgi:centromeric protein E